MVMINGREIIKKEGETTAQFRARIEAARSMQPPKDNTIYEKPKPKPYAGASSDEAAKAIERRNRNIQSSAYQTGSERLALAKGGQVKTISDIEAAKQARSSGVTNATKDQLEKAKNLKPADLVRGKNESLEAFAQRRKRVIDAFKRGQSKLVKGDVPKASDMKGASPKKSDYEITDEEGNKIGFDWESYAKSLEGFDKKFTQTEEEEVKAAAITKQDELLDGVDIPTQLTREEIAQQKNIQEEKTFQDEELQSLKDRFALQQEQTESALAAREEAKEKQIADEKEILRRAKASAAVQGRSESWIRGIQTLGEQGIRDMENDLDELVRDNEITLNDLKLQQESLIRVGEHDAAASIEGMIDSVVKQQNDAATASYNQAWEQYKFQQDQNWKKLGIAKDMPEIFDIGVIDGQIQATMKSPVEIQTAQIAAKFGQSMEYIQDVKKTFGEGALGGAIIAQELSKYGIQATQEMMFPPDKKTLESQLSLMSQLGKFSPETLNTLAMGGQILGMEMDEQEKATLQNFAWAKQQSEFNDRTQAWDDFTREEMFKAGMKTPNLQLNERPDGSMWSFDPQSGDFKQVQGANSIFDINTTTAQSVTQSSKLAPTSSVTTTANENGVLSYGNATSRVNGNECGGYVNDVTGMAGMMGDTFESKIRNVPEDPKSKTGYNMTPVSGGYFVMDIGNTGHTGMVRAVDKDAFGNEKGVYITDYNWFKDAEGNPQQAGQKRDAYIAKGSEEWNMIRGFGATGLNEPISKLSLVDRFMGKQQKQFAVTPQMFDTTGEMTKTNDILENLLNSSESLTDLNTGLKGLGASGTDIQKATALFISRQAADKPTAEEESIISDIAPIHPLWQGSKTSDKDMAIISKDILSKTRQGKTINDILLGNLNDTGKRYSDIGKNLLTFASGSEDFNNKKGIQLPLNMGKPDQAMVNVENELLKNVDGQLKNTDSAKIILKNSNRVLELLEDVPSYKLGKFDAIEQKFATIGDFTDEETLKTQQLETAMVNLYNEIRRQSLGTAVTETELQFLKPLLSSLEDQPSIIKTKVDELKIGTTNQYNQYRSQVNLPEANEQQILSNDRRLELYKTNFTPQINQDIKDTRAANPNISDEQLKQLLKNAYPNVNVDQYFGGGAGILNSTLFSR